MAVNVEVAKPAKAASILLVEDSMVQRLAIAAMLEHNGYRVEVAEDGEEALHLLGSVTGVPDLVITDIGMPHMNGISLCRRIKENPKTWHIPVIVLTSLGHDRAQSMGVEAGAADFVRKPVAEQELIYRVNATLSATAQSQDAQRGWYGVIFEALADGVLITDARGCYWGSNQALLRLLGYSRQDLEMLRDEPLVLDPKDWADYVPQTIADAGLWSGRVKLRCKTGASNPIEARVTATSLDPKQVFVWLLARSNPSSESSRVAKGSIATAQFKPADLVEEDQLHLMLGFRSGNLASLTDAEADRLLRFKRAVESAAAVRRIHRFSRVNQKTGEVTGVAYVREELERIIRNRG